ncbi:hypothetical protein JAAARDRAFT_30103 [Jaapia argillacea MUCL 33604]|uniref:Methyltransferase type 11 domain-containing protein n=1 Tax=Jaapia argillacea MUCL 33604 TaxID=933084 RepID=A0A067QFB4_9AGAM|nr:hypothetical protein JAAARDRAFT_30103 [Jaapia argillacea MUCL 33604]
MSRGDRVQTNGNLSRSMRDNYTELGVDDYYKTVGATYRNPHFPGVRQCMFLWLNKWWQMEQSNIDPEVVTLFDMACDSGEATLCFIEWWQMGKNLFHQANDPAQQSDKDVIPRFPKRNPHLASPPALNIELVPVPRIVASDPYTVQAFSDRTSLPCSPLSFRDIAAGDLPTTISKVPGLEVKSSSPTLGDTRTFFLEMIVCSFALHLVPNPSELFALLWELSTKARWMVVLAPHKKPEIKEGWGWIKWNVDTWAECPMSESKGEFLRDRVHCRVYRSVHRS